MHFKLLITLCAFGYLLGVSSGLIPEDVNQNKIFHILSLGSSFQQNTKISERVEERDRGRHMLVQSEYDNVRPNVRQSHAQPLTGSEDGDRRIKINTKEKLNNFKYNLKRKNSNNEKNSEGDNDIVNSVVLHRRSEHDISDYVSAKNDFVYGRRSINSDRELFRPEGDWMWNSPLVPLPPNVTGLCPEAGPENGLDPCVCTNNGGSLGGTINIDCPPEVSSQAILEDIIQRTTFFTTDVNRFSLVRSEIGGVFNMDMFLPLTVRELIMNHDKFQSVDNHAFNASAHSLISISLANNDISYFHFGAVSSEEVPYLQYLDISGNDLQFLPQDAFVHPQLETVSIAHNNIYTISQHCFSGLTHSQLIDVSNNFLSDLQSNTFSIAGHSTASVLQINISNNSIRYIPPDAFGELVDLSVNLSDNDLTELDEALFLPIIVNSNYFAFFQADGNPIECDCDIFWIVNSSQIMECFDNFHCANIEKTLYQLTPQDMPECEFFHLNIQK